ncbi:methyltransferase [Roseateles aquatilis]|uniref:Protein MgtC n=1 Tax=Roseateles aquatilis TaxID=431061 RepID=A0A246IW13_9BURK|nr:MgtC/SapB family protein [Roseateles aquatilis]OWQ84412.1 methyltransferase [Roseateles aquatilis]
MSFDSFAATNVLASLHAVTVAFLLGGLIGFERQVRQRTAGLRTNALVAVGAAVFVDLAVQFNALHGGSPGPMQVIAYVISGIGFLGAGAIMKEGANVSGLNTAATLWGSAAVGACAGAGLHAQAMLAAFYVLAANTLLRPVVNRINRRPLSEESSEATYSVYVICERSRRAEVLEAVSERLESARYPARDIQQHPFGQTDSEIEATLFATAVVPEQMEAVMRELEQLPGVSQAFWNASSED